MPKNVEAELVELQHMFLWDGKKAKVSHQTMMLDTNEGGKQILNLPARNEAIDLWNLQSYLMQGEGRASWCFFVDFILSNHPGMNKELYKKACRRDSAECLRLDHRVREVQDALKIANRRTLPQAFEGKKEEPDDVQPAHISAPKR
jgi:hypothetical protein